MRLWLGLACWVLMATLIGVDWAQGAPLPLVETPRPTQTQTSPACLPPGMPAGLWTWPIVYATMEEINVDGTEDTAPAALVVYSTGGQKVAVVWVGARMATVDLDLENKSAMPWLNLGVTTQEGRLRLHPSPTRCEWFQLRPKGSSA